MVLTEFLRNLTSGNLATLAGQATATPQTITRQVGDTSASFQQAATIFQNILSGVGLPQTSQEITTGLSITGLEQQSKNVTSALNELITVREQDIKKINENFRNFAIATDVTTEQAKSKASTITESLKAGLSDLQLALGGTGLVIGIIVVGFIVLKK